MSKFDRVCAQIQRTCKMKTRKPTDEEWETIQANLKDEFKIELTEQELEEFNALYGAREAIAAGDNDARKVRDAAHHACCQHEEEEAPTT